MRGNRQTSRHDNEGCCQKSFHLIPEMFSSRPGYAPIPARKYSSPVPERFRPTKINFANIGKIPDSISLIDPETDFRSANIRIILSPKAPQPRRPQRRFTDKCHEIDIQQTSPQCGITLPQCSPTAQHLKPNLPRQYPFSWKVQFPGANPPRRRPISWMVQ